jgi:hypothetical protein
MLIRVDIYHPPFLVYLYDPAHDHISDIWSVSLPERPNTYHLIYLMHYPGHTSVDLVVFRVLVGAVTSYEAFSDVITRKNNSQFFLGRFLL